jgi:drug/metabolite transporter (DMT)-like permease
MTSAKQSRFRILLAFALVYVFWGSTYLGIGIAVEHIPPALMCAVRFLISGSLMLLYCALAGRRVRFQPVQLAQQAAVGILLLVGGNMTLAWAEQYVSTGLAALLVAVIPIWFLVLDSWLIGHHRITARDVAGLLLGIAGLVVLLWPKLAAVHTLGAMQFIASVGLLFGAFSWALGSVLSKLWKSAADPLVATGWQMTFAGAANLIIALLLGQHHAVVWTARGMGAIAYLVVFGSWIGYTSYIYLLEHVSTSKVSTYAYVNPVVAVFLGWLILHERVDNFILTGSAIIIAAVVLVTSAKVEKAGAAKTVVPALETVGD